ncbi:EamA family transporter RarD [Serratia symbiotica]|nr:EamA family transporter RarD [Serratia symbiotica]
MDAQQTRQGIFFALAAYLIWGIAPVYFKLIQQVPADEILTHRVIWSFFFILLLISLSRNRPQVRTTCQNRKRLLMLAITALLIGGNWLLYIWAVNNHHMLEASLGYFINPLVNVLLGMLFFGERFRRMQWLAVALAFLGVLIQLWQFGSLPIIGLGLAFSFACYGLLRKKIGIDAQTGMLIETLWLLPAAAVYLLLMATGIVTTVPLLFFTAAANHLRLSTLGFFQYLASTLVFLLAVTFYSETVGQDKLVTFGFIWAALVLFTLEALYTQRKRS